MLYKPFSWFFFAVNSNDVVQVVTDNVQSLVLGVFVFANSVDISFIVKDYIEILTFLNIAFSIVLTVNVPFVVALVFLDDVNAVDTCVFIFSIYYVEYVNCIKLALN